MPGHKHAFKYDRIAVGEAEDRKQNKPVPVTFRSLVKVYKCACGQERADWISLKEISETVDEVIEEIKKG